MPQYEPECIPSAVAIGTDHTFGIPSKGGGRPQDQAYEAYSSHARRPCRVSVPSRPPPVRAARGADVGVVDTDVAAVIQAVFQAV